MNKVQLVLAATLLAATASAAMACDPSMPYAAWRSCIDAEAEMDAIRAEQERQRLEIEEMRSNQIINENLDAIERLSRRHY